MENNWTEKLKKYAEKIGLNLNDEQLQQFYDYWEFLTEYNSHTNLVSNTDAELTFCKHFADSISFNLISKIIEIDGQKSIIDIGTGGGFPGIPIIIGNQKFSLCAIDSVAKKTKFLEQLSEKLNLSERTTILTGRIEEQSSIKENFDFATSRAVSRLDTLSEYCLPFVKIGGYFIAYKAKESEEEINEAKKAISILGGEIETVLTYTLPDEIERKLILIKKIKKTPDKYPRKVGIPKKNPLGGNNAK